MPLLQSSRLRRAAWWLALFLCIVPRLAADYDRTSTVNAILAKETEIRWLKEDLQALEREESRLREQIQKSETSAPQLAQSLDTLQQADADLAAIHSGNLGKTVLKMLFRTAKTVVDSVGIAKTGAQTLVNHGFRAAAGEVAWDRMTNQAEDETKKALGMDPDDLSSPRTVKVNSCTQLASQQLPELKRVQHGLGLSLDAVKGIIMAESGLEEVSDDVAILRKNVMVRDYIAETESMLLDLQAESDAALAEAETHLPVVQSEITVMRAQLAGLQDALTLLQKQLKDLEAADQLAANAAQVDPVGVLPTPVVTVPADPPNDYQARLQAARVAAVLAEWDAQAPALMSDIDGLRDGIENLWSNLNSRYTDNVVPAGLEVFLQTGLGLGPLPQASRSSLSTLSSEMDWMDSALEAVQAALAEVSDLTLLVEDLRQDFIDLANAQNDLLELINLVERVASSGSVAYGDHLQPPFEATPAAVEEFAAKFLLWQDLAPRAIESYTDRTEESAGVYAAINQVSTQLVTALTTDLAAAENAHQRLVQEAQTYQSLLLARSAMAPKPTEADGYAAYGQRYYGYWTGEPSYADYSVGFVRVLDRNFNLSSYRKLLAETLQQEDLGPGRTVYDSYAQLVAAAGPLRQRYLEAQADLAAEFEDLEPLAAGGGFAVLGDAAGVSYIPPGQTPPPQATDANERYGRLIASYKVKFYSDLNGGPPEPDKIQALNYGLASLAELPDPDFDEAQIRLVAHRIYDLRQTIATQTSAWQALSYADFQTLYFDLLVKLQILAYNTEIELRKESPTVVSFDPAYVQAHSRAAQRGVTDLGLARQAYLDAHPPPTVVSHTLQATVQGPEGGSAEVQLTVVAQGEQLRYRWYVSQYNTGGAGYSYYNEIPGTNAATLVHPVSTDKDFYCRVSNDMGEAVTAPIHVTYEVLGPPLQWVGATSRAGQVGEPFSWSLTTSPAATWWHLFDLPPGLEANFWTGVISGTPTTAGTYTFRADASRNTSFVSRDLTITIAAAPFSPPAYEAWLEEHLDPTLLGDPNATGLGSSPAGDGFGNLLKFALGLDPAQPALPGDLLQVSAPAGQPFTLFFQVHRPARDAGVVVALEQADSPFGPWSAVPGHSLVETGQGDLLEVRFQPDQPAALEERFYRLLVSHP